MFAALTLFGSPCADQELSLTVEIQFAGDFGPEFSGYRLENDTLFLGKYFWKSTWFKGTVSYYKSVSVPIEELDQIVLQRIRMLISYNEFFVQDSNLFAETTGKPTVYKVRSGPGGRLVTIIDYQYFEGVVSKQRYLLTELHYLMNELIPDRYKKFEQPSGY